MVFGRMEYRLAIENTPATIPGGTGILLIHPSTGETDRLDTDFLGTDVDRFLVVSTRTTAREVQQKLEHYGVDESRATILDTLSIERGYGRRSADNVFYVAAPDDLDGIVARIGRFLEATDGKRRISLDSISELAYYAGEEPVFGAIGEVFELLREHDAVGLFHLSPEVHETATVERYEALADGVIRLDEDGTVTSRF